VKFNILQLYKNSFSGLRKEVWWLAFITFINRAGTMVIPFLSLYMKEDMLFTKNQIGWIMSSFGLGSLVGAWIGGKLTDKWGFYPVMFTTLFVSGFMFIGLQFINTFVGLIIGIFLLLAVADGFRPAAYVAINSYSKPENRTRSVTLIRLAINLGFAAGPALGGLIISTAGYSGLFWVDGITCVTAAILFFFLLERKQTIHFNKQEIKKTYLSPYRDKNYLIFLISMLLICFAFMQLFSTLPLYYREKHFLEESTIGLLMGMNGLIIFALEMPLVKYLEQPKISIFSVLISSTILFAISFFILNITSWTGIVIIGVLFITIGEMLNFPFLNRYALDRAEKGKSGEYMALFSMTFSASQIFSHNVGMRLINTMGYKITWDIMGLALLLSVSLFFWLRYRTYKFDK
jgi:predicted MFS family arabinose efflux permease